MHIKEITYQNDYIWKCSYNYLNFLNSHSEKIIFKNVHYTIALTAHMTLIQINNIF